MIVGISGVILSVIMHELFHVFMHMGDIQDINVFPDSHAIVEVLFVPTTDYDLVIEEAMAYGVTMITLILTAMLIGDIHDARDKRTIQQIMFTETFGMDAPRAEQERSLDQLGTLLGLAPISKKSAASKQKTTKK